MLNSGERRPKDDPIFDTLGSTDELTSSIGFAREFVKNETIKDQLHQIQCIIQDLQSLVATPSSSAKGNQLEKVKWEANHVTTIETWTDEMTRQLPQLKNFIIPVSQKQFKDGQ